jgi:hypothetical protein
VCLHGSPHLLTQPEDENGESAPIYHDGKFIGCLYDRADTQTAIAELAYRDKYRKDDYI